MVNCSVSKTIKISRGQVAFELNGMRRDVYVPDPNAVSQIKQTVMADPADSSQIGAPIPGLLTKISVKPGDAVKKNDSIAVIEAMKMETDVVATMDGTIKEINVREGDTVEAGELIITIE